jgi:hypothetical protein
MADAPPMEIAPIPTTPPISKVVKAEPDAPVKPVPLPGSSAANAAPAKVEAEAPKPPVAKPAPEPAVARPAAPDAPAEEVKPPIPDDPGPEPVDDNQRRRFPGL